MISRRKLLLASAASVLLPGSAFASSDKRNSSTYESVTQKNVEIKNIAWSEFRAQMTALANAEVDAEFESIIERDRKLDYIKIAERGLNILKQLDITSAEFKQAVDASYETGNRYWLWQRMIKGRNINGGILTIDSEQLVQLHDHPGATGMVRVISGEAEVWQFDPASQKKGSGNMTELVRVSHRVLKVGDMAVLHPEKGNIHALRAINGKCEMLDFFIPPYQRSQRSWYEPLDENWFEKKRVACKKIPQHAYLDA